MDQCDNLGLLIREPSTLRVGDGPTLILEALAYRDLNQIQVLITENLLGPHGGSAVRWGNDYILDTWLCCPLLGQNKQLFGVPGLSFLKVRDALLRHLPPLLDAQHSHVKLNIPTEGSVQFGVVQLGG